MHRGRACRKYRRSISNRQVQRDGKWGIIDKHVDASVPCVYDSMSDLYDGWFEVSRGDAWGYVSNTGIYAASYSEYEQKKSALGKSEQSL